MKTKKFKRVLTLVLALAMMLSLSMVAFAGNPGTVSVIVRYADYDLENESYTYTTLDTFNAVVGSNTSVHNVISTKYGSAADLGAHYLEGLTINSVEYSSIRVEADDSCYDPGDYEYLGGDEIIDALNERDDFIDYDCVYWSAYRLMEDDDWKGYYFMGDMQHMCSITYDWIYEVDYASDGYGNFVYPPNMTSLGAPGTMMTIDECDLSDGDIVRLTYGLVWVFFQ